MGKSISTWKDCRDSSRVEKFARSSGLEVREGKGSHKVMKDPNSGATQTFYSGDISTGVAVKLFKYFKYVGLIGLLVFLYVQLGG